MILVFGGTTEGRLAVKTLDRAGKPYLYSTRGGMQKIDSPHAEVIHGELDADAIRRIVEERGVRLIVDAAHPFAVRLHATLASLPVPVVRLERRYPPRDPRVEWCEDYADAVSCMERAGVGRLLALTGVQTIGKLRPWWSRHADTWFRILDRAESRALAEAEGFPASRLLYYDPSVPEEEVISRIAPAAVITKESGETGGFTEKVDAALALGVKVFAVCRPSLPHGMVTVTGPHTLRRAVERLLPGFFDLRSGVTTGTCATAAVMAAVTALVEGRILDAAEVVLPDGESLFLPVEDVAVEGSSATASVRKDAGDDPDVTDGHIISVTVSLAGHGEVRFSGGEGVGRVTLPGLGLPVGAPAINPVPRAMMERAVRSVTDAGVDITVTVPGGEELALRTFNPRVGVVGGISIIGTSGIVQPFSHEAFIEAVRREMEVAVATDAPRVVVNSGARSEKAVRELYPFLPPSAFIHYGNAVGETLAIASSLGVRALTIGLMIGKAVKLAEGRMDTHSHLAVMNRRFLTTIAAEAGCSPEAVGRVGEIALARELWGALDGSDADRFFPLLLRRCLEHCREVYPDGALEGVLIADDGSIRYRLNL